MFMGFLGVMWRFLPRFFRHLVTDALPFPPRIWYTGYGMLNCEGLIAMIRKPPAGSFWLRQREKLPQMKQRWLAALPIIAVSVFLLLSIWAIFGTKHLILPAFLTLFFRTKHTKDIHLGDLLRHDAMMLLVCLLAFLATRHLVLCIGLNLVVPFLLGAFLSSKFNPKAYFVYGMAFVFLQLSPISADLLPMRLLALTYGLVVVNVALMLSAWWRRRKPQDSLIRRGLKNLSLQLEKLADGQDISQERAALLQLMPRMSQVIYDSRRYSYLANGFGKLHYLFLLMFQRFHYFTDMLAQQNEPLSPEDRIYFRDLSTLFWQASLAMNLQNNQLLLQRLEDLCNHPLHSTQARDAMPGLLAPLRLALMEMQDLSLHKLEKEWRVPKEEAASSKKHLFNLDLFQIRFALRLSVVLCISFTFTYVSGLNHAYWYPMSAFLMLMPYAEESILKINNRIIGTAAGVLISFALMNWMTTTPERIALLVVVTCLMYYAPITSWTMPMYSTCYAMALATLSLDITQAILFRMVYVGLAAATTLLANRFLLPNTAKSEFRKSVQSLFEMDHRMVQELRKACTNQGDRNVLRDLVVQSHLLSQEIENYMKGHMSQEEQDFFRQMLPTNRRLVSEIEQLNAHLLYRRDIAEPADNQILQEVFSNLEDAIRRVRMSYLRKDLTTFRENETTYNSSGRLADQLYFNTLVFNCMHTVQELSHLSESRPSYS